ncbi:MAG: NAD(P)-binding protein [Rhodospirillaceae bacterium]|jgi:2,4-dienoyl-CoA reductase-like NADH-dependent reductase (Old Yellow Enzyme family)|nr:NAD(P)-binding protein [Rhodospirillaceae bacterium]MBT5240154.1 NAD(P)-binding protein [Rhodospirillaceae bacterium]MBT5566933.1 NAD(P)-binding protein [Rhodospirillaceae bacterium]MBT6090380.1 NAD(P)-binding protein [Rhodospirillaceae bacterium]MBT6959582.1 NAD(P)-binding protein [Rhodospirillaceae bacterium]
MSTAAFPHLTSSFQLGPVDLRNRVVIPGHSMVHGDSTGGITEKYRAYLTTRAKGGASLIGIESAPIHPNSQTWNGQVELWRDDIIDSLAATADEVHAEGAKLSIIMWHGGHNVSYRRGAPAMAPSAIPSVQIGEIPRAMSVADIKDIIPYYVSAAERCIKAGLDVLEVQTSSDYLLGSFLNPQLNHRTDGYGGSVENRCRIVLEILEAIRAKLPPHVALGIRTSIYHAIPGEMDGYTIEHSLPAMEHIAATGLTDYVSVMAGSNANFAETIPPMTYPRPQIAELSAKFKQALNVPVIVAGRITTPADAEAVLANEQADLVALARAFIADADWMTKVETGQVDRIRQCTGCNQVCLGFAGRSLPAGCNFNAEAGREDELPPVTAAKTKKRVAIVGGGPAGLECARVAAERGHDVTLYEAANHLGGELYLAANCPNRDEFKLPLEWWVSELGYLGVDVRLNTRVEDASSLAADEVVWAVGGEPTSIWQLRFRPTLVDGIPGTEGLPHSREVLSGTAKLSGSVLVIDEEGGWPALNFIEALVEQDDVTHITVATNSAVLGLPDLGATGELPLFAARLKEARVTVVNNVYIASVDGRFATASDDDILGPFDSIALSMGAAARPVPDAVHAIGDCVAPRGIWAAVQEGARLARAL